VSATLEEALTRAADVLVDFTSPGSVKQRTLEALARGVRVVIGTSGLTAGDYLDIERKAIESRLGVIAAGNFSITALAKHFALIAPAVVGDHRLRQGRQGGCPERNGSRTGRSLGRSGLEQGGDPGGADPRRAGGQGSGDWWHPSAFDPLTWLRDRLRVDLRTPARTLDDPS
jgi:hypothetical protein